MGHVTHHPGRLPVSARLVLAAVALALSCGCSSELPAPADDGPGALPGLPRLDVADASGADAIDTADTADTADTSVADAADTTVADTADMGPTLPTSCLALLGSVTSGEHTIDPDGASGREPVEVYCDMLTDGGGWTLVARSDTEGSVTGEGFGWKASTGAVGDIRQPYSLDVEAVGLAFTEILVGSRYNQNYWQNAYRLRAPADFLNACASVGCEVPGGPVPVLGSCWWLDSGAPTMLTHVGFTDATDRFHLRDIPDDAPFGLFADDFWLNGFFDCPQGGDIEGWPGLVMVR